MNEQKPLPEMEINNRKEPVLREEIIELLRGGFAPNIILLREFDYKKAGIVLDGLHFSAWILLGHIRNRHQVLLKFMKDPENNSEVWPEAHWPENHEPKSANEWNREIDKFESELQEMIEIVKNPEVSLFSKKS